MDPDLSGSIKRTDDLTPLQVQNPPAADAEEETCTDQQGQAQQD